MRQLAGLDVFWYKRLEAGLAHGTAPGGFLSVAGGIAIAVLVMLEFAAFVTPNESQRIILDASTSNEVMGVSFNVTFPHLPCGQLSLDVEDVMGFSKRNVTRDLIKTRVDLRTGRTLGVIADDGLASEQYEYDDVRQGHPHATLLNGETFDQFVKAHRGLAVVSFGASWCPHCQKLGPTWDKMAGLIRQADPNGDIALGRVECTDPASQALCAKRMQLRWYPSLIPFADGERHPVGIYTGADRKMAALMDWMVKAMALSDPEADRAAEKEEAGDLSANAHHKAHKMMAKYQRAAPLIKVMLDEGMDLPEVKEWLDAKKEVAEEHAELAKGRREQMADHADEHPAAEGCNLAGVLKVKKVPGSFRVAVGASGVSVVHEAVNMTHIMHSLRFGEGEMAAAGPGALPALDEQSKLLPTAAQYHLAALDNTKFISRDAWSSFEHHADVLGASYLLLNRPPMTGYLFTSNAHAFNHSTNAPHARFAFDPSPLRVVTEQSRQPFYRFVTSLMAIVGGAYTILNLADTVTSAALARMRKKQRQGKLG